VKPPSPTRLQLTTRQSYFLLRPLRCTHSKCLSLSALREKAAEQSVSGHWYFLLQDKAHVNHKLDTECCSKRMILPRASGIACVIRLVRTHAGCFDLVIAGYARGGRKAMVQGCCNGWTEVVRFFTEARLRARHRWATPRREFRRQSAVSAPVRIELIWILPLLRDVIPASWLTVAIRSELVDVVLLRASVAWQVEWPGK
jgi:hypothetical protein